MYTRLKECFGVELFSMLIILLSVFVGSQSFAQIDPLIEVTELSATGKKFTGTPQLSIFNNLSTGSTPNFGLDLTLNTTFLSFFYWHNTINSVTDRTQFRMISYKFEVGARVLPCLDLEYGHNSQHVLDVTPPNGFPVYDYIGFKLNLINTNPKRSIFWYYD